MVIPIFEMRETGDYPQKPFRVIACRPLNYGYNNDRSKVVPKGAVGYAFGQTQLTQQGGFPPLPCFYVDWQITGLSQYAIVSRRNVAVVDLVPRDRCSATSF